MLGLKIVSLNELKLLKDIADNELKYAQDKINFLMKQLEGAQKLAEYWQERADAELERADRLIDNLMLSNGMPDVTNTTRKEHKEAIKQAKDDYKEREKLMKEMFAEEIEDMQEDGIHLTPELQAAASQFIMDH